MKITDEAKVLLSELLASNDCDCVQVIQQQSCCGTTVAFVLIKLSTDDRPASINGINVMMDDETRARAETITLSAEDGELITEDDSPSCTC